MRKKRKILGICLFVFVSINLAINDLAAQANFIFILTDDQPYGLLGCEGNEIARTPHIDALAAEGIMFSNAHITSAICTPSRVSILLSQFERKHGVNFNSGTSVAPEAWANAYPLILREAGYYTGYIGKNHAPVGDGGYGSGLMEQSFDYWYAGHEHLTFYPKTRHKIFADAKNDTQVEIVEEGVMDFLSPNEYSLKGAVHFLESRPPEKPFCLSICFNLPHGAGTSSMKQKESDPEIYKSLFRDIQFPLPENYISKDQILTPRLPLELHHAADRQTGYNWVDAPESVQERLIRTYQAMTGIDKMLGEIRSRLKTLGLDKNTIIVFSSDHGLFYGQMGMGGKALCYEVCTHVPMIFYLPEGGECLKGKVSPALVQSIDIAPTLLSMAGIDIPETYQGKDLLPYLTGKEERVREYIYTENLWSTIFGNPRCESVQDRRWKYVRYYENNNESARDMIAAAKEMGLPVNKLLYGVHDPQIAVYRRFVEAPLQGEPAVYEELFDLENDPGETANLVDAPELQTVLSELRDAWKQEIAYARGHSQPLVLRYTDESKHERVQIIPE